MDTDEMAMEEPNCNHTQIKIPSLIHDLKLEIATFVIETRALLQQKTLMNQNHLASITWAQPRTSVGLLSNYDLER